MAQEKRYIPIAVLLTVIGFALFLIVALQAGTSFQPAAVLNGAPAVSTIPGVNGILTRISAAEAPINQTPSRIVIPRIGVDAVIEHVGVNSKSEVGIPVKFENTAWFNKSVRPGEAGNSMIDGHVNDRASKPAVFADLKKLETGDTVIVYYPDGAAYVFVVDTNDSYPTKDVPMLDLLASSNIAKLNLITCTGTWIQDIRRYDERLVVTTHLVGMVKP